MNTTQPSAAVDQIWIDRENRQRRELPNLEELAASIKQSGLIQPVVITKDYKLVAGERRFTAVRDILGWTHIDVRYLEDCSESELYLIELEENVKRVDLTWQEQCHAVAAYHALRMSMDDEWSASKTSEELGMKPAEVSQRRAVARALDEGNELVCKADRYSTARGIVARATARKVDSAQDQMSNMLSGGDTTEPSKLVTDGQELQEWEFEFEVDEAPPLTSIPFLHENFNEWAQDYEGTPFNFLHCDFPYGVNANKHALGAAGKFGGYEDSEEVYWQLLETLANSMHNVVSKSAHMMFWFSMDYYARTKEVLEAMGWTVNPFPLIWFKNDNSGIMPDPTKGPRRVYETAFLCYRGERVVVQPVANTIGHPNTKEIHMSEKPREMLAHFFRMFVDDTTTMLDPTMGSGNAVIVAQSMGAKTALGLEQDETFYANACDAYLENTD